MASRVIFVGKDRDPKLIIDDCPIPEIGEGQILAKIRLATLCGSDVHTIEGRRNETFPSVLGHEAVAEVIENRRIDLELNRGDRITFSICDSCGECRQCMNLLPQKCAKLKKYGHRALLDGSGFNGCYATHIVLDSGTAVYKIPDNLPDRIVAPINCALSTMVNALSDIPKASPSFKTALIQGAGLLGVYGCVLLKERGFDQVFCTDTNLDRVAQVKSFGGIPCHAALPQCGSKPVEDSVDLVVEVCGAPSVVSEGLRYLRAGGLYIFVGMVHPGSHLNLTAEYLIKKCLTLKGVHNYAPRHLEEALKFITDTKDKYPYEVLLSPHVDLRDFNSALQLNSTRRFHRVAIQP